MHSLDWFHVTMRLTVLTQTAKGAPETIGTGKEQYEQYQLRPKVLKQLESIKVSPVAWQYVSGLEEAAEPGDGFGRGSLLKARTRQSGNS
jgi:hypothetical protein